MYTLFLFRSTAQVVYMLQIPNINRNSLTHVHKQTLQDKPAAQSTSTTVQ
eukprot:m.58124 g.58124  ORF g.58124 m.58124 type:complete len:50 (-) comp13124_c1_seq1:2298-2447(-)